mmetsp:Transcript_10252/g.24712  ORF Transcript_10252/g.24712 Transcript_10252/m.24712 type:complete len:246 (+) Transcript_10252:396-1133(+)
MAKASPSVRWHRSSCGKTRRKQEKAVQRMSLATPTRGSPWRRSAWPCSVAWVTTPRSTRQSPSTTTSSEITFWALARRLCCPLRRSLHRGSERALTPRRPKRGLDRRRQMSPKVTSGPAGVSWSGLPAAQPSSRTSSAWMGWCLKLTQRGSAARSKRAVRRQRRARFSPTSALLTSSLVSADSARRFRSSGAPRKERSPSSSSATSARERSRWRSMGRTRRCQCRACASSWRDRTVSSRLPDLPL